MQPLMISIAGVFGVLSRYYVSLGITRLAGTGFPYATVLINVLGSFLIGAVYVLGIERTTITEVARVALMVGFLGGFTTFSSFSLETVRLLEGGQWGLAAANVVASVAFCIAGTAGGMGLMRAIAR